MTWRRRALRAAVAALVVLGAGGVIAWTFGAAWGDGRQNGLEDPGPYDIDLADRALLEDAGVVDLHADALLWDRDLRRRGRGHVDIPRLVEGGVALQVFGIVTKVPWTRNYDANPSDSDGIGLLAFLNHWPPGTWRSVPERAHYQAEALQDYVAGSSGRLLQVRTAADIDAVLERRAAGEEVVGATLGLEGLQVLEGDLDRLDDFFAAGVRMGGLAHFFDNEVAGSAHGEEQHGLTPLGRQVVQRMEELGMVVDLAHASTATIADVLAMATRPVVVSHGGVAATCPGPRTLTDEQLRGIAATGGVVGIGYFEGAVCDVSPDGIAAAMAHVADVVGVAHVALGSDFDGAVTTAFDVTGVGLLVEPLRRHGLDDDEIRAVLSNNAIRVLREVLPRA